MSKVVISILTYNSEKNIKRCLESVFNQTFRDFEITIVDNSSNDQTIEEIKKLDQEKVRIIENGKNLGFAEGHNQVIRQSQSEYIFLLNDDVVLEPDHLKIAVDFLDENNKVASVSGKLLRLVDDIKTDTIDSLGLKIFKNQRVVEIGSGKKDVNFEIKEVFGVSGAVALYRREALEQIRYGDEYFDKDFFMYKEDVDLAYRLRWSDWQSFVLPQAVAYHQRTAKSEAGLSGRKDKSDLINRLSYRNHLFVLYKNLTGNIFFCFFPYIFLYEFKKLVYILFFEISSLKGCKEFFKKIKKMKEKRMFIIRNRKVKDKDIYKWYK